MNKPRKTRPEEREHAGREGGWLPIASAPRDGTYILAGEYDATEPPFVTCWRTFRDGFGEEYTGFIEPDSGELGPFPCYPTVWQPLPQPPTAPKEIT